MARKRIMAGPGLTTTGGMADWVIPRGNNLFNAAIVMQDHRGVTWRGYGSSTVSRLEYVGGPTQGFQQVVGSSRCQLKDFELVIAKPDVDAAVLIANSPVVQGVSTNNVIENVRVRHGGKPTAAKRAFSVDSSAVGGVDGNNDLHHFIRCQAESYRDAAYYINGSQCHDLYFRGCTAHDHGGRKPIGLHAAVGIFFTWHRGSMTANSVDFKLGGGEIQAVIDGHNSEHSEQLLTYSFTNGIPNISIRDVRWEGAPVVGRPVVDIVASGPVKLDNMLISGINGVCPKLTFGGTRGSVDLSGLTIRQHGGVVPNTPIITAGPGIQVRQHGLLHQRINENGSRTTTPITVNVAL
jgi:hypothetical protein